VEHGVDGFLVDDIDEAVLAVRLARGLDRARIRQRALDRFNPARMVADYERVYNGLVAGKWTGIRPRRKVPISSPIPATRTASRDTNGMRINDFARREAASIQVVARRDSGT
jgi:hypothetical protein